MNIQNHILAKGTLSKNKTPYFIRPLYNSMSDLINSDILQAAVLDSLPATQTLLHPRTWTGFARRRDGEHGITLGVFAGNPWDENAPLIAQQTLLLSADKTVPLLDGLCANQTGCTEGYMVHPQYRGNQLTDILMHHIHCIGAEKYGLTGFMSCADASNPYSYNVMLKNGYGITAAYIDPADGGKTYAFFRQSRVQMATEYVLPKIESGHFEEIQFLLQSSQKPVIIYQQAGEKICTHAARERYTDRGLERAAAI